MTKLGIAIELEQVRTAVDGKTRWQGVKIESTGENVKKEMRDAFAKITGPVGKEMRKRLQEVRGMYVKSWKEGKSRAAMEDFGRFAAA